MRAAPSAVHTGTASAISPKQGGGADGKCTQTLIHDVSILKIIVDLLFVRTKFLFLFFSYSICQNRSLALLSVKKIDLTKRASILGYE